MEYKIRIPDDIDVQGLFGNYDANIRSVEKFTGTEMNLRDGELSIRGRDPELAARIIARLIEALAIEPEIDPQKLSYLIEMESGGRTFDEKSASRDIICYTHTGRPLRPKTQAQKDYVDNIRNSDMVFGIGPAGTGKTYLAARWRSTHTRTRKWRG
jgi:phosphate starvation-inducible PhoH-like protein